MIDVIVLIVRQLFYFLEMIYLFVIFQFNVLEMMETIFYHLL